MPSYTQFSKRSTLWRKFSDENISCTWNVLECFVIIVWRGMIKVEHPSDNFFRFSFCLSLFLTNIVFCLLFLWVRGGKNTSHVELFLRYMIVAPALIHVLSVLFGAPFLKYWDQTISFSMLGSALILPSVAVSGQLGNSSTLSGLDFFGPNELWTGVGAWIGAFVIPLDWDRPWQVWPEPCCLGAVVGCGVGNLMILVSRMLSAAGYQMYWPTQFFVHER